MNKLELMKQSIKKTTGRTGLVLKKHSPEILMGAGILGIVGSTVLACKATLKVEDIIDEARDTLDTINEVLDAKGHILLNDEMINIPEDEDKYTSEDAKKDKAIVYVKTGVELGKLYAPAISLGIVSIACLMGSHNIMKKRNVAVVAAYKAVEESFANYRRRVVEEFGKDKDEEYRYGIVRTEETITETDKNGKKKKVKKTVDTLDPNHVSQYARFFDESCANWSKTPEYNLLFLKAQQNYANDLLKARGHIFLNEVYDMLGIERSQAGAVVGWVLDKDSDNFVDFGIYNGDERGRAFVNGYERSILLDFNVDGVIYDLI